MPRRAQSVERRQRQTSLATDIPQACSRSCGTYLLCLFLSTQSLSEVEDSYWCGRSPSDFTIVSNELGPAGGRSIALPQFGLPRLLIIVSPVQVCRDEPGTA